MIVYICKKEGYESTTIYKGMVSTDGGGVPAIYYPMVSCYPRGIQLGSFRFTHRIHILRDIYIDQYGCRISDIEKEKYSQINAFKIGI